MLKSAKKRYYSLGAAMTMGLLTSAGPANAQNTFSNIAQNITTSIQDIPGLLSGLAYLIGTLLGVLGIMKIKDHVENPGNTPLKEGAIRLAAGGALFALPILFEAMTETIGQGGANATAAQTNRVQFNVN